MATKNQIVGGGFQNAIGAPLANGYILFELSQDAQVNTTTQIAAGFTVNIPLDASGNVVTSPVQSVWPNDVLSPAGTFYNVSVYSANGQLVWGPNAQQVLSTPSPFVIGTWVPASVNLGAGGGGSLNTVSIVTANGVSGTVVTTAGNSAITLSLAGFLALNNTWTGQNSWTASSVFEGGVQADIGLTSLGLIQTSVTTPAMSGSNQNAPNIALSSSYWNGSAAATDSWTLAATLGTGTNPTSQLTLSHTGSTGSSLFALTSHLQTQGIVDFGGIESFGGISSGQQIAAFSGNATSGTNLPSPQFVTTGTFWNGSISVPDSWNIQNIIGTGTNPTSTLTFSHQALGTTGDLSIRLNSNTTVVGNLTISTGNSLILNGPTTANSATAGSATVLPSTPLGYVEITIAGTLVKVPYYSV
jgi:hypothetical protein